MQAVESPEKTAGKVQLRLLGLARDRGVSLAALSAMIGRNNTYLQQFVRKGSPRKLEEGDRRKLARFFGVTEADLGREGGLESRENSYIFAKTAPKPPPTIPHTDWVDVPRLALDASAGGGALAGGAAAEQPFGALRFARGLLRAAGLEPALLAGIAVAGDSMEPTLRDGDEILVDMRPHPPRDGVHVVRVGEVLLVKRLDLGRPGRITLLSDNPAYHPQELPAHEVRVIGRVVWKSGRL